MVFRWCRSTRAGSWGFEGRWSTLRQRSSNALPPSTGPRRVKPLRPTGPCRVGKGVRPRRRDGRSPSRRPGGPAPQWWQRRPRRPPVTPQTHPRTDGLDRRGSVVGGRTSGAWPPGAFGQADGRADPNRERCRSGGFPGGSKGGGSTPRQSASVLHRVGWLVSHNHADSRVICMTGSRGRPGLLSARGGERSEPERALNRDGGRIDRLAGRKGAVVSVIATVLPNVLNGYTSIEARITSTGEGKNS